MAVTYVVSSFWGEGERRGVEEGEGISAVTIALACHPPNCD